MVTPTISNNGQSSGDSIACSGSSNEDGDGSMFEVSVMEEEEKVVAAAIIPPVAATENGKKDSRSKPRIDEDKRSKKALKTPSSSNSIQP